MARGWESKSVADQMEQTETRTQKNAQYDTSPAVRARLERLESLKMSRTLTLAQLERPMTHAHRQMLQRKLRALEDEIEKLG